MCHCPWRCFCGCFDHAVSIGSKFKKLSHREVTLQWQNMHRWTHVNMSATLSTSATVFANNLSLYCLLHKCLPKYSLRVFLFVCFLHFSKLNFFYQTKMWCGLWWNVGYLLRFVVFRAIPWINLGFIWIWLQRGLSDTLEWRGIFLNCKSCIMDLSCWTPALQCF